MLRNGWQAGFPMYSYKENPLTFKTQKFRTASKLQNINALKLQTPILRRVKGCRLQSFRASMFQSSESFTLSRRLPAKLESPKPAGIVWPCRRSEGAAVELQLWSSGRAGYLPKPESEAPLSPCWGCLLTLDASWHLLLLFSHLKTSVLSLDACLVIWWGACHPRSWSAPHNQ